MTVAAMAPGRHYDIIIYNSNSVTQFFFFYTFRCFGERPSEGETTEKNPK